MTIKSLADVEGRTNIVKVVAGFSDGADIKNRFKSMAKDVGRGLAKNGFGLLSEDPHLQSKTFDEKQIISFDISDENSFWAAIERAEREMNEELTKAPAGSKGRVVVFTPQMDDGKGPKLATEARNRYREDNHPNVTILADAYTDCDLKEGLFPDIALRAAIARHVAFYFNGGDKRKAIELLNDILRQVVEGYVDIRTMDDLAKKIEEIILRIRPVDYNKDFRDYERSQVATATAA